MRYPIGRSPPPALDRGWAARVLRTAVNGLGHEVRAINGVAIEHRPQGVLARRARDARAVERLQGAQ